MNNILQRVLTAVVLIGLLVFLLLLAPADVMVLIFGGLVTLAAWEWSAFLALRAVAARVAYVVFIVLALLVADWLVPDHVPVTGVLWIALAWWFIAFLWVLRFPTPIPPAVAGLAGVLVLVPAWLAFAMLLRSGPDGPALVLLVLCVVWAADVGAYAVGRRIGRVKLAPRVSPGKTWEGVVGGLAAAALMAGAGGLALDLPLAAMVPIGLAVAAVSVVGDLTESLFKRNVGLKDSGRLFPGHGGLLDRIDSITAAVPVFCLLMRWLGAVPP